MKYYDSSKILTEVSLDLSFNHGTTANIYRISETDCFKVYFRYTNKCARMKKQVFDIIKKINHQNVYKLIELFYREDNKDIKILSNLSDVIIDAYKYEYLESQNIEIFEINIEYLLNSLKELENFVTIISMFNIKIFDFRQENTLYTKNNIMLIDLDKFEIDDVIDYETLLKINKKRLVFLFRDLMFKSKKYKSNYLEILKDLFDIDRIENIYEEVSKKLVKFKNISDYLKY